MSGFAGVFMRTGATPDAEPIGRMAAAAPYRGAHGSWFVRDGAFAAVRQLTNRTDEDCAEVEAVRDGEARVVMLFDGRLDNRSELCETLRLHDGRDVPDARLALSAWKAWGESSVTRLIGDFALAVWDARGEMLFCARDPMGVRPLFYSLTDTAFVFASEVRQVLAHPLTPHVPDEKTVAGLLSISMPRPSDRTLYQDVKRLPHAHAIRITRRSARTSRYWCPDLGRELRLRDDREYAAAFREVFDRAVAARLRGRGAVGAYLSGGLDSSSVLVTARAVGTDARSLTAFSLVFPAHPRADERRYSTAVADHAGVSGVWLEPPGIHADRASEQAASRLELPDFPHDYAGECVRAAMAERGIHIALTGSGGDIGLSGSHYHYADLLRRGRLVRLGRRYLDVARQPAMRWTSADLLRCAAWPLLPAGARRWIRPLARRVAGPRTPPWIAPGLALRAGCFDTPALREVTPGQLARTDVHDAFDSGWIHMALDMYQRGSLERGIEDRHPFFDRRLVEFALALPDEQRWQRGRTRYVLRQAMGQRLPDLVRDRPDDGKGEFSHLCEQALDALGGSAFFSDTLEVALRGWVVPSEARRLYSRMRAQHARGDTGCGDTAFSLWTIAALELWHRGVFGLRAGRMAWIDQTGIPNNVPMADARASASRIGAQC